MTSFSSEDFQQATIEVAETSLQQRGYYFAAGSDMEILGGVEFRKLIQGEIIYLASYKLNKYFTPPNQSFMIYLSRARFDTPLLGAISHGSTPIGLRNLLWGFYEVDPFPPDKYEWEFSNSIELRKSLNEATLVLIEYGLPWLEARSLEMAWVQEKLKPRSEMRRV